MRDDIRLMNASGRRARIETGPIKKLLLRTTPCNGRKLDALFASVQPVFEIDDDDDRILFQADAASNIVTIGLKCTCRLQAHALAAGVIFAAHRVPRFKEMSAEERMPLLAPADRLLTWAVAKELQQTLRRGGIERSIEQILSDAKPEIDEGVLQGLTENQRRIGMLIFQASSAYVLLHELGHLYLGHRGRRGADSFEQEKDADRFAAEWLLGASTDTAAEEGIGRISALVGISLALLWITIPNVFLGPHGGDTHPEGYDRLFQVLDQAIDWDCEKEYHGVWEFVSELLFLHMTSAGFKFSPEAYPQDGDPREEVNYLIDRIANFAQA